MATDSSEFYLFPCLPVELRIKIWEYALPEADPPAVTPYTAGCWRPTSTTPNEDMNTHHTITEMKFYPELLDHIRVKLPLYSVNHEARATAIEWAHKRGIERSIDQNQREVFLRPFDPTRDVLWVGPTEIHAFNGDTWCQHGASFSSATVAMPIDLRYFAVSESLLDQSTYYTLLSDTVGCFPDDTVLYLVVGEQPRFDVKKQKGRRIHPRWELCDARERENIVWDHEAREFDVLKGEEFIDDTAHKQVVEACKVIGDVLRDNVNKQVSFELRAVLAVRIC